MKHGAKCTTLHIPRNLCRIPTWNPSDAQHCNKVMHGKNWKKTMQSHQKRSKWGLKCSCGSKSECGWRWIPPVLIALWVNLPHRARALLPSPPSHSSTAKSPQKSLQVESRMSYVIVQCNLNNDKTCKDCKTIQMGPFYNFETQTPVRARMKKRMDANGKNNGTSHPLSISLHWSPCTGELHLHILTSLPL